MIAIPDHNEVLAALAATPYSVACLDAGDERVWAKRAPAVERKGWVFLQRCFFAVIRMPMLRPPEKGTPAEALAGEAQRLQTIQRLGFHAPDVLNVTDDYLLLSDAGENLHEWLRERAGQEEGKTKIKQAAETLAALHRAGGCHGRAALKDFVIQGGQLGYIDCEEDPAPLEQWGPPRDLLLFCQSVAKYSRSGATVKMAWDSYDLPEVKERLRGTVLWLKPLVILLWPVRSYIGRDARQLLLALRAILGMV